MGDAAGKWRVSMSASSYDRRGKRVGGRGQPAVESTRKENEQVENEKLTERNFP
jgi:hypothetical protein